MVTPKIPVPGQDSGVWGDELDAFLRVSLNEDGTIKTGAIATVFSDSAGPAGPLGDGRNAVQITIGPYGEISDITTVPMAAQPIAPIPLVPTGSANASAFCWHPIDLSIGNVTETLPTAPPDLSAFVFSIAKAGAHNLTINTSGSDTFPDGSTTRVLSSPAVDKSLFIQYDFGAATYYIRS